MWNFATFLMSAENKLFVWPQNEASGNKLGSSLRDLPQPHIIEK
jgi:hypothetical protein